jgi:hypothetical protein
MKIHVYLIDYAVGFLCPVSLLQRIAERGIAVMKESIYPEAITHQRSYESSRGHLSPGRTVTHEGTSGIVLAAHMAGLVAQARKANGINESVPRVCDFVVVGETPVSAV